MRAVIKKILSPFLQAFVKFYFSKPRSYRYKEIKALVLPGVFFPHFTISTKLLLQFLEPLNLRNKSFLELGCGTGIISVLAATKGAQVTASDINPQAIENANLNAEKNGVEISICTSDLFSDIPGRQFDFIIINPPYYPKAPQNPAEEAWFCGENFEYFEKLFSSLLPWIQINSQVLMILSEDCEIERIRNMAAAHGFKMTKIIEKKKWGEWNFIFRLDT
jgi:release factor glutamine methyltransferase